MDGRSARETSVVETRNHGARNGTRDYQRDVRTGRGTTRRDQAVEGKRAESLVRLLEHSFQLMVDHLTGETVNRDVKPITLFALHDKVSQT